MVCRVGETIGQESESPRTILVEFGNLTDEQHMLLDLHTLRALGDDAPRPTDGRVVVAFWISDGETPDAVYDDIRGWAIGNRLPVGRMVEG
jgi:hypothetical protein